METLTRIKSVIDKIVQWLCIIILGIMTVLVTYQVVTRYFFNKPSGWSEITAQYLFVWAVMFGSALVFGERGHLEITTVKGKLPPTPYMIVEILTNILLVAFAVFVLAYGGNQIAMSQMKVVDASLQIPMGWIYYSIPVHGVIMAFYGVYNCLLAVKERNENNHPVQEDTAGTM